MSHQIPNQIPNVFDIISFMSTENKLALGSHYNLNKKIKQFNTKGWKCEANYGKFGSLTVHCGSKYSYFTIGIYDGIFYTHSKKYKCTVEDGEKTNAGENIE